MEVVLNINDLTYENLFQNINLNIEKGKIISFAGCNNCGKTTLSRILDRKIKGNFNINLLGKDRDDYSLQEYDSLIQVVYPDQFNWIEEIPYEEFQMKKIDTEKKEFLLKKAKELKILDKENQKLTRKESLWQQILLAIGKAKELVVIDGMDCYLTPKETEEVYYFLRECTKKWKQSFLITTTSLENTLLTDELYILKEGEIILKGDPLTILQKDNLINKAGLKVPFMIDLSVKLRDYDLLKEISLEKETLIDNLWN